MEFRSARSTYIASEIVGNGQYYIRDYSIYIKITCKFIVFRVFLETD